MKIKQTIMDYGINDNRDMDKYINDLRKAIMDSEINAYKREIDYLNMQSERVEKLFKNNPFVYSDESKTTNADIAVITILVAGVLGILYCLLS